MEESIQTTATNRAFARELQSMLEQAEGLLRNAGQQIRNEYRNVKEQVASSVSTSISDAQRGLSNVEGSVLSRSRGAVRTTNRFVREKPWRAVIIAAGAGVLLGMIMTRKR